MKMVIFCSAFVMLVSEGVSFSQEERPLPLELPQDNGNAFSRQERSGLRTDVGLVPPQSVGDYLFLTEKLGARPGETDPSGTNRHVRRLVLEMVQADTIFVGAFAEGFLRAQDKPAVTTVLLLDSLKGVSVDVAEQAQLKVVVQEVGRITNLAQRNLFILRKTNGVVFIDDFEKVYEVREGMLIAFGRGLSLTSLRSAFSMLQQRGSQ